MDSHTEYENPISQSILRSGVLLSIGKMVNRKRGAYILIKSGSVLDFG